MMSNKAINSEITLLGLDRSIENKLRTNSINYIKELWSLKRKDLKKLGLTDSEIKHIIIKLQLHSMDLNQKVYNKN